MTTEPKLEPCPAGETELQQLRRLYSQRGAMLERAHRTIDELRAQPQSSQVSWKPKTREEFCDELHRASFYKPNDAEITRIIDSIYAQAQKELRRDNEKLRRTIKKLLLFADREWREKNFGHDWATAVTEAEADLATDRKEG